VDCLDFTARVALVWKHWLWSWSGYGCFKVLREKNKPELLLGSTFHPQQAPKWFQEPADSIQGGSGVQLPTAEVPHWKKSTFDRQIVDQIDILEFPLDSPFHLVKDQTIQSNSRGDQELLGKTVQLIGLTSSRSNTLARSKATWMKLLGTFVDGTATGWHSSFPANGEKTIHSKVGRSTWFEGKSHLRVWLLQHRGHQMWAPGILEMEGIRVLIMRMKKLKNESNEVSLKYPIGKGQTE